MEAILILKELLRLGWRQGYWMYNSHMLLPHSGCISTDVSWLCHENSNTFSCNGQSHMIWCYVTETLDLKLGTQVSYFRPGRYIFQKMFSSRKALWEIFLSAVNDCSTSINKLTSKTQLIRRNWEKEPEIFTRKRRFHQKTSKSNTPISDRWNWADKESNPFF